MKTSTLLLLAAAAGVFLFTRKASAAPGKPGTPAGPTAIEYVVKPGDSLSAISKTFTGTWDKWKELYDLNRDLIGPNPEALQTGAKLILPNSWMQQPLIVR